MYCKQRANVFSARWCPTVPLRTLVAPPPRVSRRQALAGMAHLEPTAGEPAGFVFEEDSRERAKSLPGVALFAAAGVPRIVLRDAGDLNVV